MTQEEKQLLLKDICGRLPYAPQIKFSVNGVKGYEVCELLPEIIASMFFDEDIEIKPYLRLMSSMTEEEVKEFAALESIDVLGGDIKITCVELSIDAIDWLNKNHFDYRGLIQKGLALKATPEMYKTE